ncbi:RasGTPase-activating protein, partial [Reticulomyxa filosa]
DLIMVDPNKNLLLGQFARRVPVLLSPDTNMIQAINVFRDKKTHFALVTEHAEKILECLQKRCSIPEEVKFLGCITMEDIMEELIQENIEDEYDDLQREQNLGNIQFNLEQVLPGIAWTPVWSRMRDDTERSQSRRQLRAQEHVLEKTNKGKAKNSSSSSNSYRGSTSVNNLRAHMSFNAGSRDSLPQDWSNSPATFDTPSRSLKSALPNGRKNSFLNFKNKSTYVINPFVRSTSAQDADQDLNSPIVNINNSNYAGSSSSGYNYNNQNNKNNKNNGVNLNNSSNNNKKYNNNNNNNDNYTNNNNAFKSGSLEQDKPNLRLSPNFVLGKKSLASPRQDYLPLKDNWQLHPQSVRVVRKKSSNCTVTTKTRETVNDGSGIEPSVEYETSTSTPTDVPHSRYNEERN